MIKRNLIIIFITIGVSLMLLIGYASYAYFNAASDASGTTTVTATTGNISTLSVSDACNFSLNVSVTDMLEANGASSGASINGNSCQVSASVKTDSKMTCNYTVKYTRTSSDNIVYSSGNTSSKPEEVLNITRSLGSGITVTSTLQTPFDITGASTTTVDSGKITFSGGTSASTISYGIYPSFKNYNFNQNDNAGKTVTGNLVLKISDCAYGNSPNTTVLTSASHDFATDAASNVSNALACLREINDDNPCSYNSATTLGETFSVDMGTYGTHTIRVANLSTPSECSTSGFSQTACGIVLEFADIITTHNMNPSGTYKSVSYSYGWNVDGYPSSSMYTFVNNDIYNAIPASIRSMMISTKVVSGHGSTSGESNYTTSDKLYLLGTHDLLVDVSNTTYGINDYDTAYNLTRQLDYYSNLGVTTSNYSGIIKQYNSSVANWWLRSAGYNRNSTFYIVLTNGSLSGYDAVYAYGVSPAFRIG